jgi:hypothetical protein
MRAAMRMIRYRRSSNAPWGILLAAGGSLALAVTPALAIPSLPKTCPSAVLASSALKLHLPTAVALSGPTFFNCTYGFGSANRVAPTIVYTIQSPAAFAAAEKTAISLGAVKVKKLGNAAYREPNDLYVLNGPVQIEVKATAPATRLVAWARKLV